jgi:MSHA biogenesis protein MshM
MYQDFFKLNILPFNLTPNTHFFCQLTSHKEALNTLEFCIKNGEGFVKIIGEVGSGKTLLCRKLLESLHDNYITAYIPNPDLTPVELRKALARELGLDPSYWQDQHELVTAIYQQLISLCISGKKIVFLIDEAQALSDESLEALRLLTNLESESTKLLQIVLFGQPELNDRLNSPHFRQLKQRISFSYELSLMTREDLDIYLYHRLMMSGYLQGNLFTKKARNLLFRASGGVPRMVNIISHKALLVAYGKGDQQINHKIMRLAIKDTEVVSTSKTDFFFKVAIFILMFWVGTVIFYLVKDILQ